MSSNLTFYRYFFLCITTLFLNFTYCYAQENQFGNWTAWFNNVKFSNRWGMNNDIQFRGGRNWSSNSLLLIRPGINYYIADHQTASAGYATTLVTNALNTGQRRLTEHRIWEQYLISDRIFNIFVQHRFRFEQRFLKRPDETIFSQRIRYFIRGIIPLATPIKETFTNGMFFSLQNETFLNVQNKGALNGNFFDQNRAYTSIGYRFSQKYDLEIGYMNQFILRRSPQANLSTHIAQIAFYTRW